MRHLLLISLISSLLVACQPKAPAPVSEDLAEYEIVDIPDSPLQKAIKRYVDSTVLEEGQLLNGIKTGTWLTYTAGNPLPEKIMTYANGMANGPYFELNIRGQIEVSAYYKNNRLDGYWAQYQFGRPTIEAHYKDGELHGVYREYATSSGQIQKEISYKNGKMDGRYLYYDQDGNITLDYMYKNGEKVSQ